MGGFASAGLMMLGSIVSGYQQGQELKSMENMAEYNAKVSLQEAKAVEIKSAYDSQRQAQAAARVQSTLAANLGGSGVDVSVGSPLLIKAKQASELELENLFIGYEGRISAQQMRNQAALDNMQADLYKQQARNRILGGWLNAGALGAQAYSRNQVNKPNNQNSWWNNPFGSGNAGMGNSGSVNQAPGGFPGFNNTPTTSGSYYA